LDSGAAKALLPLTLTSYLAKEEFREQLIAHLHAADDRLEDRCAVTLMHLPASEIRSWAECVKMPNEVRDFSEIFSELNVLIQKSVNEAGVSYQPAAILTLFNRADVWRKPDRGNALLDLAKRIGLNVDTLISAMQNAQSLNTAKIIEGVPADQRTNGERIRSAVDAARLSAITAAINS
jgi:tRNA nucleotidyltransferase (CCA-adding enzyme)